MDFEFNFDNLESQLKVALNEGYQFYTIEEFIAKKEELNDLSIVLRIDVDFSIKKVRPLLALLNDLAIKATWFIRLHAPEYNPFSFEGYRIIRDLIDSGHELGYHSEIVDQAAIWNENASDCLVRDLAVLETMFNVKIKGVASHGGTTGLNNLDFWKDHNVSEFDLLYEGYDRDKLNLFNSALYLSDSEWTRWKCYRDGVLLEGDRRNIADHVRMKEDKLIYLLIHSDTYFVEHFYE